MKKLTITADDFGAHPAIDKGIMDGVDQRNIDNVDCMVTIKNEHYDGLEEIKKLRQKYKAKIDFQELSIGLHLSLTCGKPVSIALASSETERDEIAALFCNKNDEFKQLPEYNYILLNNSRSLCFIKNEFNAQLAAFIKAYGKKPDHISCHTGAGHLTKKIMNVYLGFCNQHKIPVRNPVIISKLKRGKQPKITTNAYHELSAFKRIGLGRGLRILFQGPIGGELKLGFMTSAKKINEVLVSASPRPKHTDYFIDNFYCNGSKGIMQYLIENIQDYSYELVVHPISDLEIPANHPIPDGIATNVVSDRQAEWRVLRSEENLIAKYLMKHDLWKRFRLIDEQMIEL